jgi:hypothetical protein
MSLHENLRKKTTFSPTVQAVVIGVGAPLRLQSPRSAFADTPTRRYADTATGSPFRGVNFLIP